MTRVEEVAERFATCRDLAACLRRQNIPRRFVGRCERRAAYWRRQFAFALADKLDRNLFGDEIDAMLFLHVGSGSP